MAILLLKHPNYLLNQSKNICIKSELGNQDDGCSGKYAIMGCILEIPSAKWAFLKFDYGIYYPLDCLERKQD